MSILLTLKDILNNPWVIALVAGIFSSFVATKYYYYKWKARDKTFGQKAFKTLWIPSRKLKYKDLEGRTEFPEKNPSTQAHLSNQVQELIDNCKNILLISEPMAGKTYFTVNYLRKLENAFVLIPDSDKFDERYEFIPKAPQSANFKIVLLDDVYSYINSGVTRLPFFIEKSIEEGYIVWANTITGPEFENVRNYFSPRLLGTFKDILIPSTLTETEALQIAQSEGKDKLPSDFDGNIGSIFYPISQIKDRYEKLDSLAKLLLLVIKQLYLIGIYKIHSQILKSNVRELFNHYEPSISAETFNKKIEELIQNGFLFKNLNPMNLRYEEKYLKKVVEPNLKVKEFMNTISVVFPKNVATYTQAIQSTSSYEEAVKIYSAMLYDEIQPGVRPFCVLIRKADDSDIGLVWLKEMDRLNIPIDDFILNALFLTTKGNSEKKDRLLRELEKRNIQVKEKIKYFIKAPKIQLDKYAYSNLMNISGNYEKALELFNEMKLNNISPDSICYNILIKLSNDYQVGMKLFNEMITEDISPDNFTYGLLINLSGDYNEGRKLLEKMVSEEVEPNDAIYGTLMKLSNNFETCKLLLKEMKNRNIPCSPARYGYVINLSPSFIEGEYILDENIAYGIMPTAAEFGTLMNLAYNHEDKIKLFNKMRKYGVKPAIETYGTIINLCEPD